MFTDAEDLLPDLGCRGITFFGIHVDGLLHDPGSIRIVREHPLDQLPEPENVRAHIRGRKAVLLRSRHTVGAHQDSVLLLSADIDLGRVVVDDLDHSVFCQHDVGGLQVAVDNGRLRIVQERQAVTQLRQNADLFLKRQGFPVITQYLLQRSALHEFLNDDQGILILSEGLHPGNMPAFMIFQKCKNLSVVDCQHFPVEQSARRDIPDDGLSVSQILYLFI